MRRRQCVLGGLVVDRLVAETELSVVHVGLSLQTNEPANGWNFPPPHFVFVYIRNYIFVFPPVYLYLYIFICLYVFVYLYLRIV